MSVMSSTDSNDSLPFPIDDDPPSLITIIASRGFPTKSKSHGTPCVLQAARYTGITGRGRGQYDHGPPTQFWGPGPQLTVSHNVAVATSATGRCLTKTLVVTGLSRIVAPHRLHLAVHINLFNRSFTSLNVT